MEAKIGLEKNFQFSVFIWKLRRGQTNLDRIEAGHFQTRGLYAA
jgi:hypothetical protein